jgi:hypothetical protein
MTHSGFQCLRGRASPELAALPIQHVRCEVGFLRKTGPLVLDARLSRHDPTQTSSPSGRVHFPSRFAYLRSAENSFAVGTWRCTRE